MTKPKSLQDKVRSLTQKVKEQQTKKEETKVLSTLVNQNLIKEVIEKSIPVFKQKPHVFQTRSTHVDRLNDILCVTISDVHIGKCIPGYDTSKFIERLETLRDSIINELVLKEINELVLFIIGDICDGDSIYPGHSNYIDMKVAEQAIKGSKWLADFINDLSDHCASIRVVCVPGNHGRDGKKGEKTLKDNFDFILYQILKVHLQANSKISFEISEDWKYFVKIGGLTFMAFHGDDIAGGNPLGTLPKIIASFGDLFRKVQEFDAAVCGHYHLPSFTEVNGRFFAINGSFSAPDDFTEKKIRQFSRPSQISFIVRDDQIIDRNVILL